MDGKCFSSRHVYNLIGIAFDETSILVAVHFSMKNIYQSCDPPRGGATSMSASNLLCLMTLA